MTIDKKRDVILFVDDEKICHTLVELIIPNFTNFKLVGALNAEEAIMLANRYSDKLALIISDIMLPGINGYELFEIIRDDEKFANIPFIFQSGLNSQENFLKRYLHQNIKIIYKPYKQADLLSAIDEMTSLNKND